MQFSPPPSPRSADRRSAPRPPDRQVLRSARSAAADAARAATTMRLLRRLHLYSGLLLLPFALVYGISGFLFNHAANAGDAPLPVPEPARAALPRDAVALALRTQQELGASGRLGDDGVRTVAAAIDTSAPLAVRAAELVGAWTFEWQDGETRRTVRLAADGSVASVREAGGNGRARGTPLRRDLFDDTQDAAHRAARLALAADGRQAPALQCTGSPTLRYETVAADGTPREVRVVLDRATATIAAPAPLDFGRFLQRLHTARGYGRGAARTAWAVVVDAMAFAMLLWSVSGLAMWWQKRSHRRAGTLALAVAAVGATALGIAMHAVFAA